MSEMQPITTDKAPKALGPYSQAIHDGDYLFVSGQLPIDPSTGKLLQTDIKGSTERVFDNLEAILESGGCSLKDVVRMDVFMKDLAEFAAMNEVYGKRFGGAWAPARQTIQVAKLPLDASIEISCIAKFRKK